MRNNLSAKLKQLSLCLPLAACLMLPVGCSKKAPTNVKQTGTAKKKQDKRKAIRLPGGGVTVYLPEKKKQPKPVRASEPEHTETGSPLPKKTKSGDQPVQ